jgi:hypothetical protein
MYSPQQGPIRLVGNRGAVQRVVLCGDLSEKFHTIALREVR